MKVSIEKGEKLQDNSHLPDTLIVSLSEEQTYIGMRLDITDIINVMRDAGYTIEDRLIEIDYCKAESDLDNRHWCVLREGHKGKHKCGCDSKWSD